MDQIAAHEQEITAYALEGLLGLPGLTVLGPTEPVDRGGAISFTLTADGRRSIRTTSANCWIRGQSPSAAGTTARDPCTSGCGVQSSTRASFYLYTTHAEIDVLVDALDYVTGLLRPRLGAGSSGGSK